MPRQTCWAQQTEASTDGVLGQWTDFEPKQTGAAPVGHVHAAWVPGPLWQPGPVPWPGQTYRHGEPAMVVGCTASRADRANGAASTHNALVRSCGLQAQVPGETGNRVARCSGTSQ